MNQSVVAGFHHEGSSGDGARVGAIGCQCLADAAHLGHGGVVDAVVGNRQAQAHGIGAAVGTESGRDGKAASKGIDVAVAGQIAAALGHGGGHGQLTAGAESGQVVDGCDHIAAQAVDADAPGDARRHGGAPARPRGQAGGDGGAGGVADDPGPGGALGPHRGEASHGHLSGAVCRALGETPLQLIQAVVADAPQLAHQGPHRPHHRVGHGGASHNATKSRALPGNGRTQGAGDGISPQAA